MKTPSQKSDETLRGLGKEEQTVFTVKKFYFEWDEYLLHKINQFVKFIFGRK